MRSKVRWSSTILLTCWNKATGYLLPKTVQRRSVNIERVIAKRLNLNWIISSFFFVVVVVVTSPTDSQDDDRVLEQWPETEAEFQCINPQCGGRTGQHGQMSAHELWPFRVSMTDGDVCRCVYIYVSGAAWRLISSCVCPRCWRDDDEEQFTRLIHGHRKDGKELFSLFNGLNFFSKNPRI